MGHWGLRDGNQSYCLQLSLAGTRRRGLAGGLGNAEKASVFVTAVAVQTLTTLSRFWALLTLIFIRLLADTRQMTRQFHANGYTTSDSADTLQTAVGVCLPRHERKRRENNAAAVKQLPGASL